MTTGSRIRQAREAAGMTQEELGGKCGTTKQTIYKYETGKIENIPLDRLNKIALALSVSPLALAGFDTASESLSQQMRLDIIEFGEDRAETLWKFKGFLPDLDDASQKRILALIEALSKGDKATLEALDISNAYMRASDKERQTIMLILSDYLNT